MKKPQKPKAVKGWAIVDEEGFMHMIAACESDKFIWRKYIGKDTTFTRELYERQGRHSIRVTISPS